MSKKKSTPKKAAPVKGKAAPSQATKKAVAKKPVKAAPKKVAPKKKAQPNAAKPAKATKPTKTAKPTSKTAKPAPKKAKPTPKTAKPAPKVAKPTPKAAPAPKAPAPKKEKAASTVAEAPAAKPTAKKPLSGPPTGPTKSGALFYDSHMHTPLCKHAWGDPEDYAKQGIKAGLKGIIFTCHCPMPDGFWPTVRMAESEFDTYLALVQRAAETYKNKLHVCLGLESEYFPGYEDYLRELHQRADFDYILGAVHWQAREYLNKFESGTIENFRRIYFENLALSAESGLYDCLAHPDLVKNYHPDSWCFAIIKNSAAAALDRIAATGVAMELNTSGLNKSYHEMNPGEEMLRMMCERKIPIVIGSDAHRAERVGDQFVTALNQLVNAGYEKVSYFQKRQRIDLKISDVLASLKKATDANA